MRTLCPGEITVIPKFSYQKKSLCKAASESKRRIKQNIVVMHVVVDLIFGPVPDILQLSSRLPDFVANLP